MTAASMSVLSLAVTLTTFALPVATVVIVDPVGVNTTIVIGYFLQAEPRIAVIGMAIKHAQSDGLLVGYGFE